MKHKLPVAISGILIGLLGLTSCTPVEGRVVSIPNELHAHQAVNNHLITCSIPGGQEGLVTRNTSWSVYQGNGSSEVTPLSAVAVINRGSCTDPSDIVVDDSEVNSLAEVTDPGRKQEIIQELCDGGAIGSPEYDAFVQALRDLGKTVPLTERERFCGPER